MPNLDMLLSSTEFQGLPAPEVAKLSVNIPAQSMAADTGAWYYSNVATVYDIENYWGMFRSTGFANLVSSGYYQDTARIFSGSTLATTVVTSARIRSGDKAIYMEVSVLVNDVSGLGIGYSYPATTIDAFVHIYDKLF